MVQTLWLFLAAAVWPLAKKILASLGIGFLTYQGLSLIAAQVQGAVLSSWGQLGGVTLQILSLAGIPQAIGIALGAMAAKTALLAVGRLGKVSA